MRIVMLGTGTDVGKTYVTSRLAEALRGQASVLALKPIESGVVVGAEGDAERIARAAAHAPLHSSWRFTKPVSPHLAAREEGKTIELGEVNAWVRREQARHSAKATLVETAGGVLSPLARGVTNLELAVALEPALWVLIAPDSLGVLHDVTATLRALPRPPDAVVLSAARPPDASSGTNARELGVLGIATVTCVVREQGGAEALAAWLLPRCS